MRVEIADVGDDRHKEIAGTKRPVFLVQFCGSTPRITDLVHGPVVGATSIDIPVKKRRPWISSKGIDIEDVCDSELSSRDGDPRNILFAAKLVRTVFDRLLLAPKAECLPQKNPPDAEQRH